MPTFYPALTPDLTSWCTSQPVFFTATAPTHGSHVNISPKGHPSSTFRVLGPTLVAYLDATGSGSETIAHVYENGRVTVMFASFAASPRILRLFCRGRVAEVGQAEFAELMVGPFRDSQVQVQVQGEGEGGGGGEGEGGVPGVRAVVVLEVLQVQTSCGYGVPILGPAGKFEDRDTLNRWAEKKVAGGEMAAYRAQWNAVSLDGLPALRAARKTKGEKALWVGDVKAWIVNRVGYELDSVLVGAIAGIGVGLLLPNVLSRIGKSCLN